MEHLISWMIAVPFVGIVILAFVRDQEWIRPIAFGATMVEFGLSGTCNFIGEFLVLVGTSSDSFVKVLLAMGGIVLAASYMLWMLQRVALGQSRTSVAERLPDLNWRETATMIPLVVVVFWVGLYPAPLLNVMDVSVTALVQHTTGGLAVSQLP